MRRTSAAANRCALRQQCLSRKGKRREIERWEYEAVIDRHRARIEQSGEAVMHRRKALAEHPFETLKRRGGYHHFLLGRLAKVRANGA